MISSRLKGSKAWTDLPEDFKTQVTELFGTHFKKQAKNGQFQILGRIYKSEIVIRFIFTSKDSIKPVQFDLSTDYSANQENKALNTFERLVDCAASLFQTSFDDEEFGVPALWTEIDFDGIKIFAKSDGINQKLEDEANKLLGDEFLAEEAALLEEEAPTDDDGLIKGELDSDDIVKTADILNKKPIH